MSDLRRLLIRRLQEQKLDKPVMGTLVIKQLNHIMGRDDIQGHVKNKIIFVKTYDQALRIKLFQQKQVILSNIIDYLREQGFSHHLTGIRIL